MKEEAFVLMKIEPNRDHQTIATVTASSFGDAVNKLGADPLSEVAEETIAREVTFSFERLSSNEKVWHNHFNMGVINFFRVDESGNLIKPPLVIEFDRYKKTALHKYILRKVYWVH